MEIDASVIERAKGGDRGALEDVVRGTKDLVYNLSIRMLGSPADAEDATQEILIRIITHLGSFRGESAFRTWAYRVASNHLLNTKKRGAETRADSLEEVGERIASGIAAGDPAVEDQALMTEAKLICTSTMLAVLDRDHRLAFILGEIFEMASEEAAAIIGIQSDAYRKRLSRARERMTTFMGKTCGIVDDNNSCTCGKLAGHAVVTKLIDPKCLVFSSRPARAAKSDARLDDLDTISRAIEVFRGHPDWIGPDSLVEGIRRAIESGSSDLVH